MKTIKVPPGAKRLIESLRDIGYDFQTAVADLIDNSLVADASEIHVEIYAKTAKHPASHIVIADNGRGMDRTELTEAMRFGSERDYAQDDLGKYGLGLKTASLSQCSKLTVASRPVSRGGTKARRNILRWDLQHVYKKNAWELIEPEQSELDEWEQKALDHEVTRDRGTAVVWSNLSESMPLLEEENIDKRMRFQARLIEDLIQHLRMVFHRFIQGTVPERKKVDIFVSGTKLKAWDPFCLETEKTRQLDTERYPVNAGTVGRRIVVVKPYVLPNEKEFSTPEAFKEATGPLKWNQQQGFYFYRNHRMLQAGGWNGIRSTDEHIKLLRIAVDFPSDLDKAFAININKMRAKVPDAIREDIKAALPKWVGKAESRYRGGKSKSGNYTQPDNKYPQARETETPVTLTLGNVSFAMSNANATGLIVAKGDRPGRIKVVIPHRHELSVIFSKGNGNASDLRRFCTGLIGLLEAVHEGKMKPDAIPLDSLKKTLKRYL